jgi:hypothetical protein
MHASRRIILVIKIEQSFRHSDWWSGEYFDGHDPRHGGFEKSGRARVVAKTLKGAVVVPQRAVMEVQGQLSACDRRRGWEGGNASRAGRAPRGNGPGDHLGTRGRRKGDRGGNSEVKSGVPVVAKLWTPNAERSVPEVENETRRAMCGAARSATSAEPGASLTALRASATASSYYPSHQKYTA